MRITFFDFKNVGVLLGLFLAFSISTEVNAQFRSIDLQSWRQEGTGTEANWNRLGDDTIVQTINGAPTFFVGLDTLINTIFYANIIVEADVCDDFIGFVFGYQRPIGDESMFDFVLFDWRRDSQEVLSFNALEGFTLSRVTGNVSGQLQSGETPYWDHTHEAMEVLDSDYGPNKGWEPLVEYAFEMTYTESRILVKVNGDTIFNTTGTFKPGRLGFYNYSQPGARYTAFSPIIANGSFEFAAVDPSPTFITLRAQSEEIDNWQLTQGTITCLEISPGRECRRIAFNIPRRKSNTKVGE